MDMERQKVRSLGTYTVRNVWRGVEVNHRGEILGRWCWYGHVTTRGRQQAVVLPSGGDQGTWWTTDLRYVVTKEQAIANLRNDVYSDRWDRLPPTCLVCGYEGDYVAEGGSWPRCPECQNC